MDPLNQVLYLKDQLGAQTLGICDGPLDSSTPVDRWHPQLATATHKAAAQEFVEGSSGQSTSGSSAFSAELCLESAVLQNWEGSLLDFPRVQHQLTPLHTSLSRGHSAQSNQLPRMDSPLQQEVQPSAQPLAADSGSWDAVVLNPALNSAASQPPEQDPKQMLPAHQQDQPALPSAGGTLQDTTRAASAAAASPQLSGSGMCAAAPASPSTSRAASAAADDASGQPPEGTELAAPEGIEAAAAAGAGGGRPLLPEVSLKVACGEMIGTLLVHRAKIVIHEGSPDEKEVSPTEFERLGGRSATKKWKQSIRLVNEDGELGRPVGEWYVLQGLEQPKKPRESKELYGASSFAMAPAATARSASPPPEKQQHGSASSKAPHKRPVRAAARHISAHIAAEAAGSPTLTSASAPPAQQKGGSRKAHSSRSAAARAAAAAVSAAAVSPPTVLEDAGSGTADSPPDVLGASAAWLGAPQDLHLQQQQQQQPQFAVQSAASMVSPTASNVAALDEAEPLDAAALGAFELPPGAAAAAAALPAAGAIASGGAPLLVPVPVAQPLPGDASQAVVEMTAYLEGRRSTPPWRLLPQNQRPVIGRHLVPLRQLFVLVMQAGGYLHVKDDILMWQDLASQMGLPAWPNADVPDPLRALQQVYRDYLLRFEGRFTLPEAGAGAASGVHHSPTLSTTTQQQPGTAAPAAGYSASAGQQGMPSGSYCGFAADNNNFNNSSTHQHLSQIAHSQQRMLQQQPQQQMNSSLAPAAAAMVLEEFSEDVVLELLTDLIPDNDAVLPAAAGEGGPMRQASMSGAAAAGPRPAGAAAEPQPASVRLGPEGRQHPEMAIVQRRHRLQQLQQQLQQQQQQQQAYPGTQLQMHGGAAMAAGCSGSGDGMAAAAGGAAPCVGAARLKRPPPLIRCGDSDVVSLMDQSELTRLLHDYEQQHGQLTAVARQAPQLGQGLPQCGRASGIELAAAVAGAVDRNQSQDLHALMQQYWQQQGQVQQCCAQLQQQQQQHPSPELHELEAQAADEEMSGLLETLQLATEAHQHIAAGGRGTGDVSVTASVTSHMPHMPGEQLVLPLEDGFSAEGGEAGWGGQLMPPRAALLAHASIGAHLVSMMPTLDMQQGGGSCTGGNGPAGSQQQQQQQQGAGSSMQQQRPSSVSGAVQGAQDAQQQQDLAFLHAFRGGLHRLSTPNSALLGSVLDSPTLRAPGHTWMDMSAGLPGILSTELRSMTVELMEQPDANAARAGPSADDLAAIMHMW